MHIRPMKPKDYERVFALWTFANGVSLRSLDDSFIGVKRFLRRNPRTSFVAIFNGQIVGAIMCGCDGRRAYIYHAVVAQSLRTQGIGSALVGAVISAVKKQKINKIALVALSDNAAGNAFWTRMGFAQRSDLSYRDLSINENNL